MTKETNRMGAYLIDHPPVRDQFYAKRNRALTGCTVLHTAESVMDTLGPDTGAEGVAEFIRTRTSPGSYHDLADSDSYLTMVPYECGAYHDGTGSNNWALSISWACRTSDWRAMSPERRAAFLRQGARAFAAQQAWRRARGLPLTELRYITKAQSDRGESGFIEHGKRDPGRRTDPGVAAPNIFPYDEWLTHCRAALAGTDAPEADDLFDINRDRAQLDKAASAAENTQSAVGRVELGVWEVKAMLAGYAAAAASGTELTAEQVHQASAAGAREAFGDFQAIVAGIVRENLDADNQDTADAIVAKIGAALATAGR